MDNDRIAGAAQKLGGGAKDAVGGALGDTKLQAEGKADKAAGTVQNAVGGAKDAARDLAGDARGRGEEGRVGARGGDGVLRVVGAGDGFGDVAADVAELLPGVESGLVKGLGARLVGDGGGDGAGRRGGDGAYECGAEAEVEGGE